MNSDPWAALDNILSITLLTIAYLLIWQLGRGFSKCIRVLWPNGKIETKENIRRCKIFIFLLVVGILLLGSIFTSNSPAQVGGQHSSSIDNEWFRGILGSLLILSAIVTSWLIHPIQKPRPSRFDKYLGIGWMRRHSFLKHVVIILVLALGIFTYEKIALELNKHAFAKARTAIDAVYTDIVAQVGPPDNSKRTSECSRAHVTFGIGDLTCSVDTDFIYGMSSINEANNYVKRMQAVISQHKQFHPTKTLFLSLKTQGVYNSVYNTASDEFSMSGLSCIINYVYDTPRETFLTINDKAKKSFQVVIGCHGNARAMYYPENS